MRVGPPLDGLFAGLFDDASMFPPEASSLSEAVTAHLRHRWSGHGDLVGSLVCQAARLGSLGELARATGVAIPVSLVVPRGIAEVAAAIAATTVAGRLDVRAVEVPLGQHPLRQALAMLAPLVDAGRAVYLEVAAPYVTDDVAHRLAPSGIGLKLRLGETSLSSFQPESELARLLVLCAAERLPVVCAAGVHRAVRHRDTHTFLQHHGYLNLALAVRVAGSSGSVDTTRAVLADADPLAIAERVQQLDERDVRAIRAMLRSVASFDVGESVRELVQLGLASGP
jgi:hypothetical protein